MLHRCVFMLKLDSSVQISNNSASNIAWESQSDEYLKAQSGFQGQRSPSRHFCHVSSWSRWAGGARR